MCGQRRVSRPRQLLDRTQQVVKGLGHTPVLSVVKHVHFISIYKIHGLIYACRLRYIFTIDTVAICL